MQPRRLGIARGVGDGHVERFRNLVRHAVAERAGKFLGGFADQIGLADAREEFREAGDAAGLRLAARDPEDMGERRQRMRGGIRIRALGVVLIVASWLVVRYQNLLRSEMGI